MSDLPDGARAHDDHEVSVPSNDLELFDDRLEWMDMHRSGAAMPESLDKIAGADPLALGFAVPDEIDLRNDHDVRVIETGGEVIEKKSGPAVLMRLEHADQPFRIMIRPKRPEGRFDLGGMVTVVIDHHHLASVGEGAGSESLHPTLEARERGDGLGDQIPICSAAMRENSRRRGVHRIVGSDHRCLPVRDRGSIAIMDRHSAALKRDAPVRFGGESEGIDLTMKSCRDFTTMGSIMRDQQVPTLIRGWYQFGEGVERLDDLFRPP